MKKKIDHDFGSVLNGVFWVKFGEKSTKKLEQQYCYGKRILENIF